MKMKITPKKVLGEFLIVVLSTAMACILLFMLLSFIVFFVLHENFAIVLGAISVVIVLVFFIIISYLTIKTVIESIRTKLEARE